MVGALTGRRDMWTAWLRQACLPSGRTLQSCSLQHAALNDCAALAGICSHVNARSLDGAHAAAAAAAAAGPCSDTGEGRGAHLLLARPLLALVPLQAAMALTPPCSGSWAPQLVLPQSCLEQTHMSSVLVWALTASLQCLLLVRVPVPCWRS